MLHWRLTVSGWRADSWSAGEHQYDEPRYQAGRLDQIKKDDGCRLHATKRPELQGSNSSSNSMPVVSS
jgi:hypothetical protein